eukprot:355637_1
MDAKEEQPTQNKQFKKSPIKQIIEQMQSKKNIIQPMQPRPLHRFNSDHMCNIIEQWIYNDINYKKYLRKTMKILSKHALSGGVIASLPVSSTKQFLTHDFSSFMTTKTLDIIFNDLDMWLNDDMEAVKIKNAAEIGYRMYNVPINNLLNRIRDKSDPINGEKFIKYYAEYNSWIEDVTGWARDEIRQIQSVLFKYNTKTVAQINYDLKRTFKQEFDHDQLVKKLIKEFTKTFTEQGQEELEEEQKEFTQEKIHFNIKNAGNINEFSDFVVNKVHELTKQNESNDIEQEEEEKYDTLSVKNKDKDFVKRIYTSIAKSFIFQPRSGRAWYDHWICNNCGNHNFKYYIDGKINTDLNQCKLCGITLIDSIILKLKGSDTYVMVNEKDQDDEKVDASQDKIDLLIQDVLKTEKFNLCCPHSNDIKPCKSVLELAKKLLEYKHWLDEQMSDNCTVDKTAEVDLKNVDNDAFKKIFIDSARKIAKIADDENNISQLEKLLEDNIFSIQQFVDFGRKKFAKTITKQTPIKMCSAAKLFKFINTALKNAAQKTEYKHVLNFDIDILDEHYHHILNEHIINGDITTVENIFRFFTKTIHFEDTPTQVKQCKSINRREQRADALSSEITEQIEDEKDESDENAGDKNLWSLKQYYLQAKLDVIHSYLVHSDWKLEVSRYERQNKNTDDKSEEKFFAENDFKSKAVNLRDTQKNKYITSSESDIIKYGFGVDHVHSHLKPQFSCLRAEVLRNPLCQIRIRDFQNSLIKAIKLKMVALRDVSKGKFICKYFKREYNIIRNEPIGIRHILAIIIYTDMTAFCTSF